MRLRAFGRTGLQVSERGFGAWAIGGNAWGRVSADDALAALARAEELGCNFVDSAAVYGDSEALIGRFLKGRRSLWYIATKYSAQPQGMTALVEQQLKTLAVEYIDFYQVHWAPSANEESLYHELQELKRAGKIRFAGISLRSIGDLKRVLDHGVIDGIQMPVSLLDPTPLLPALELLRRQRPAVIARSALRGGFLTGKYRAGARFAENNDQRGQWNAARIVELERQADAFRFLQSEGVSLGNAALNYPLSFPEISTVVVSCKNALQATQNFGSQPLQFDAPTLANIRRTQARLGLGRRSLARNVLRRVKRLLGVAD
jgi:aryl-alcohol dehydrogenase-like predicted oxidoreductase